MKLKLRLGDFIIIGIVLALSIGALFLLPNGGNTVVITADGEEVYRGSLAKDAVIELEGNIIEIKNGVARMIHADCADGVCLGMGKAPAARPITCLPNRVVVRIEGEEESGVDAVVW